MPDVLIFNITTLDIEIVRLLWLNKCTITDYEFTSVCVYFLIFRSYVAATAFIVNQRIFIGLNIVIVYVVWVNFS